jgi:uncharacterized membrane protein YdcZ (DUF606 family)
MDDEFVVTRDSNSKVEKLANNITTSMWYSLLIGMSLGVCICGLIQHVSIQNPDWAEMVSFIYHSWPWWIWTLPITVLSFIFWLIERRYREDTGV